MSFRELPLQSFIENVGARAPTPGGGAVSAIVASLGAATAAMVGRYTMGKKRFASLEAEMTSLVEAFKATADELMQAADEDSDAFAALTVAFAMDRETEEQKQARRAAIAAESRRALQPPLKAARASLRTLMDVEQLSREFNKQLASDVVVAVHTLRAGLYGALAQVEVNLALTDDESFIAAMVAEVESMRARADDLVEKVDGRMQAIIAP